MKKRIPTFLAGALAATLVFSLGLSALAASGQVSFGGANIAIFGQQQVDAGEHFSTANGAQAPSSITYTDEKGGGTVYLPLRLLGQLLDADVTWDGKTQTADFGGTKGSGFAVVGEGEHQTVIGSGTDNPAAAPVSAPVLGTKNGLFTEVAPTKEHGSATLTYLDGAKIQSSTGFLHQRFSFYDARLDYVEITVTNHGEPVAFRVTRPSIIGQDSTGEAFTPVRLEKGGSMTRAFAVDGVDNALLRWLELNVDTIGAPAEGSVTNITVSVIAYWKDSK